MSFSVPAKPGIAKDLIEADDISRKAIADFIDSLLVKKSVFHNPIKCYKLIKFEACEVKQEERSSSDKAYIFPS